MNYWCDEGIAIYAYDQRGFGANERPGIWPTAQTLADDLVTVTALVRRKHPDKPLYLDRGKHGQRGYHVRAGEGQSPKVAGAILGAPAVWARVTMSGTYQKVLAGMRNMFPGMVLTGSGLRRQAQTILLN